MKRVPIAVIGLGFMGSRWARALAEHDAADVRIVSDARHEHGKTAADALGAQFVADAQEAASSHLVEGVVICTPEHLHLDAALAAIEAGKAVAVEKPLAHDVSTAEQIRDRSHSRGVPVLTGHILRFESRYASAKIAIDSGRIGAVKAVRHERIGLTSDQDVLQGRTTIPLYYGVHEFDLARWYAGDVQRVFSERSTGVVHAAGYDVDDLYSAVISFASGAHGTAMIGWLLPPRTPGYGTAGVTILGEHGLLRVAQGETGILAADQDGLFDIDVYYAPEIHGRIRGALAAEVDHFVDCARGGSDPICTASDGLEAVRISLAMEKSAESGAPVDCTPTAPALT